MLIQISGFKDSKNTEEIIKLKPNQIGFRFDTEHLFDENQIATIPSTIKKVGIFANEDLETILTHIFRYKLDAVEIHGSRKEKLCKKLKRETDVIVIKAISIFDKNNFWATKKYDKIVDLFLFETKTDIYKGSAKIFNWNIIEDYKGEKEFILGGNIKPEDIKPIKELEQTKLIGIKINTSFDSDEEVEQTSNLIKLINRI